MVIADGAVAARKAPSQRRSRERVERMLAAASALIEEQGSDALRMGQVAERAGVSIGSLYQFFPDKTAIIRALAERITLAGRACIDSALDGVEAVGQLKSAFNDLVDVYYQLFLNQPAMRDVWSGTQADKSLRQLELGDSRASAAALVNAMERAGVGGDRASLASRAFLVWQLGEATMRLAVSVERAEGDVLVETYKRMALRELVGD